MKLGAEPKKVAMLAGLTLMAGYLLYNNVRSDQTPPGASQPPSRPAPQIRPAPPIARLAARSPAHGPGRVAPQEFRPSLKPKNPDERPDLTTIDPTLRLDLLAKLRDVKIEGGERSLFEFGAAPLPSKPEPKIIPKKPGEAAGEIAEKPAVPVKPPPPPIPLKFYGYTVQAGQGAKRAFFLDGDDILVASEGEVMKKRYKVVRIGVNSVVVEDLDHQHEQTLPLVAEAVG